MAVLPELGLVRSEELDEVLAAVDYDHAPYAGGTELVPAMGLGLRRPAAIVDLKPVEALKRIEVNAEAGTVTIGAAVTHRRLSDHPVVREHLSHPGRSRVACGQRPGALHRNGRRQPLLRRAPFRPRLRAAGPRCATADVRSAPPGARTLFGRSTN